MLRWHAIITYRCDGGHVDVPHDLEEIGELQELVERGPHWDTIVSVVVHRIRNNTLAAELTVEQAQRL